MAITITGAAIQAVTTPINIVYDTSDVVQIGYLLNLGSLVSVTGTLTGDDQNNDGAISSTETVDHNNPELFGSLTDPLNTIPDVNNATVLGIGYLSSFIAGALVQYPVILAVSGGTQYLIFPDGTPDLFTSVLGTVSSTLTFYKNGELLPGGEVIPCFTRGTLIETARGSVAIENLKVGDRVYTQDHGMRPVRWIGSAALSAEQLRSNPKLVPIRIRKGALGNNTPSADLLVSPQHRVLVRSAIAARLFATDEVLVAAKLLCGVDGIEIGTDCERVEYFHLLFDDHEIIVANGAAAESLFTGPQALNAVGPAAVEEIFALFPELRTRKYSSRTARHVVNGPLAKRMVERHARNGRPLVC